MTERVGDWIQTASSDDGLYRVTTRYLCAGFVIEGGRVTLCAPILRQRLAYWRTVANRVRRQGMDDW